MLPKQVMCGLKTTRFFTICIASFLTLHFKALLSSSSSLIFHSMDSIIKSPFPVFTTNPFSLSARPLNRPFKVAIKPPPPGFDYRLEIFEESRAAIAESHPELLDLADNGSLVLVQKKRFGPVPSWRTEFVEPESIWLVGTTHVSKESAFEVERVVKAVRPDNVVVELCRSRAGIMYATADDELGKQLRSNMFSLSGTGFFGAVGRSINLGGQTALALRLLLAAFSSKISSDINRPFGDEFRAARKASEEVGAQLVLGDRPIEITLQRAWKSLKWTEKVSLVRSVIRAISSSSNISTNELEEARSDGGRFQLYEQLSFSYPSLLPPLIHERDIYLAWSLKRSKAVNNCKSVVGVIGKGHMNGVVYGLVSDTGSLRFRDLAGKNSDDGGWIDGLVKSLVRDTIIGIILWALYEFINGRCAACKNQRRKCPSDCIFSPYFPPNDPQRYLTVHRIYGGSNVGRMLQQIPPYVRARAADCLYYEARCRTEDPVYGCFGIISQLVQQIHNTQSE